MMKGQYFSFDAIVASVIFVLAIMALLSYWHSVRTYLDFQNSDIQKEAVRISNLMFTPPHYSDDTEDCGSMDRLGFARAWDDRVVRSELIECAELMGDDPEWLKGVMSTPFNLSITVTHLPGGSQQVIGPDDPDVTEMTEIVQMRRLATIEEPGGETHLATMDLRLYRPIR